MNSAIGTNRNCVEIKDIIKEKFALLQENDLLLKKVPQDELLERLQLKLGKSKEEIQQIIFEL